MSNDFAKLERSGVWRLSDSSGLILIDFIQNPSVSSKSNPRQMPKFPISAKAMGIEHSGLNYILVFSSACCCKLDRNLFDHPGLVHILVE